MNSMRDLVGLTITEAKYDGTYIYLICSRGRAPDRIVVLEPYGDCCAHTYVEHVDCAEALVNAIVTDVQDLEQSSNESDYEVIDTWGHRIHTDKGICTLDMRTSHNGYYGGHLNVSERDTAVPANAQVLVDF